MENLNEKSLLDYLETQRKETSAAISSISHKLEIYEEMWEELFPNNSEDIVKNHIEQKELLTFRLKWLEWQIWGIKANL